MKSIDKYITENDVQRLVSNDVFLRGENYYYNDAVSNIQFNNGVLSASVYDVGRIPYKVKVFILKRDKVYCECSCKQNTQILCVHAVAALIDAIDNDEVDYLFNPQKEERKNSLLFLDEDNKETAPIIRFILPTRNNFKDPLKGYKVDTAVVYKGKVNHVRNVVQIISPGDYRFIQNADLPDLKHFNAIQMHVLRLIHSYTDRYTMSNCLKPHELAHLMSESRGEGIEFYEGKGNLLTIRHDKTVSLAVELIDTSAQEFHARLYLLHPDDPTKQIRGISVEGYPCWFINFEQGWSMAFDVRMNKKIMAKTFVLNDGMSYPRNKVLDFKQTMLDPLEGHVAVIDKNNVLGQVIIKEHPLRIQLYLDGDSNKITADLRFMYGDKTCTLKELINADAYLPHVAEGHWIKRDLTQERGIINFMFSKCGFILDEEDNAVLIGTDALASFVFEQLPSFSFKHEVFYAQGFENQFKSKSILRPKISFGSSESDWFYFDVSFIAEGVAQEFSNTEIQKQLLLGKDYIRLKSGEMIPIDRTAFKRMAGLNAEFDGKTKKLSLFHAPYVLQEAKRQGASTAFLGKFKELYDRLQQFRSIDAVTPPVYLKGVLRDYQAKGLDWLEFLRSFQFGGILADEMGLGKTIQVLALLAKQLESGIEAPNLFVCPTTLVWNWQEEIKKFYPNLNVLVPQGDDRREQIKDIKGYHIVITSYALLRRDAQFYAKHKFNYVILDEAQNIKNRNTLNARMSKELDSCHRLVLTGTPMENSVADLWSIFDFLMPGFLGSYERFKVRYEIPILKENNKEAMEALGRKIKPFLMRRLKKEVVKELPLKMEQVSLCVLEPTQHKTYEQMLVLARKEVTDAYQAEGFNKSRMKILTVILRLRQICCHPELAHVQLGHRLSVSAKLNLLKEIISEALSGGHKVLVFSQFVKMLDIIGEYLTKENIIFELMNGSTKDRHDCVDRFNNTESVKVFLLSLKVGGVGLNLTSADTVILYEPWWNPAVEDQAIDRAHRIGQKSIVTAYKLICKGTIEEKILELQKRKKNIIDSLVVSEEGIAKSIGWEDIKFLLDI